MDAQGKIFRGFADAPVQAAWSFRAILEALACPGQIQALGCGLTPPPPMFPAAAAVALTLFDYDTTIWLDTTMQTADVEAFLKFHCGCTLTRDPAVAQFALIADPECMPPIADFAAGTPEYPDRSSTLIIQVPDLDARQDVVLSGPGIETTQTLSAPALGPEFWRQVQLNHTRYPLGIDVLLASANAVAGCPRSTAVSIAEAA